MGVWSGVEGVTGSQGDVFEVVQHSVQESESLEQMLQNILWDGRVCRDEYVCPYN